MASLGGRSVLTAQPATRQLGSGMEVLGAGRRGRHDDNWVFGGRRPTTSGSLPAQRRDEVQQLAYRFLMSTLMEVVPGVFAVITPLPNRSQQGQ